MIYKEEFYKLSKRKRKGLLKRLLFILFLGILLINLLVYFYNSQSSNLIGIYIFDEQVIKAPCEGFFRTDLKDMEKVRVGQLLGYIDDNGKKKNFEVDILNKEYAKVITDLDTLGEKINCIIDEIRISVFTNKLEKLNNYISELKKISKERLQLLNKLEQISNKISTELSREKQKNAIYSLKSGYVLFTIDSLVNYDFSSEYFDPNILKRIKYVNFVNKKVKKDTILGVVRDPNPKYLILFSRSPLEGIDKEKYIIFKSKNYLVKLKIIEIEFLKNFYKITTLPIEFDNIILKERVIEGQIIKVL